LSGRPENDLPEAVFAQCSNKKGQTEQGRACYHLASSFLVNPIVETFFSTSENSSCVFGQEHNFVKAPGQFIWSGQTSISIRGCQQLNIYPIRFIFN
jgi:hypothetical protein